MFIKKSTTKYYIKINYKIYMIYFDDIFNMFLAELLLPKYDKWCLNTPYPLK